MILGITGTPYPAVLMKDRQVLFQSAAADSKKNADVVLPKLVQQAYTVMRAEKFFLLYDPLAKTSTYMLFSFLSGLSLNQGRCLAWERVSELLEREVFYHDAISVDDLFSILELLCAQWERLSATQIPLF